MTMTAADAEKQIIAAFKKAGIEQTRIKSDDTHVEVVGLGATAIRVSVPVEGLSDQAVKDAVEAALKAAPKPAEAPTPEAPAAKIGTPPAADDDDDDDPAKPAPKGTTYKGPIGKK